MFHKVNLELLFLNLICFAATAVILIFSNVQMALFCAITVSYAGESIYV